MKHFLDTMYRAFDEFRYFWKMSRGRTRTPAEIEALEIRGRP